MLLETLSVKRHAKLAIMHHAFRVMHEDAEKTSCELRQAAEVSPLGEEDNVVHNISVCQGQRLRGTTNISSIPTFRP